MNISLATFYCEMIISSSFFHMRVDLKPLKQLFMNLPVFGWSGGLEGRSEQCCNDDVDDDRAPRQIKKLRELSVV